MKEMKNSKENNINNEQSNIQQGICLGSTDENWKMLATAIVMKAIKEYRRACKYDQPKEMQALKEFFQSEWCNALVNMSTGKDFIFSDKMLDDIVKRGKKMKISNIITEDQTKELIKESSSTELHNITSGYIEEEKKFEDFEFETEL